MGHAKRKKKNLLLIFEVKTKHLDGFTRKLHPYSIIRYFMQQLYCHHRNNFTNTSKPPPESSKQAPWVKIGILLGRGSNLVFIYLPM